jgi:deoxyxylulose-5-phosphate synthase
VIGVGTGFQYGAAGYSHWAVEDLAIMSGLEKFRIFSPSDADSTKEAVIDFLTNGGPTYIRLGKHVKNLSEVCSYKKFGQHLKIFGEGSKIIVTHGSIAIKLLDSIMFDTNKFSLLVFNEVPNSLDESFLELVDIVSEIWNQQDNIIPYSEIVNNEIKLINTTEDSLEFFQTHKSNQLHKDLFLAKSMGYPVRFTRPTNAIGAIE